MPAPAPASAQAQQEEVRALYDRAGAADPAALLRDGLAAADAGDPRTAVRHFRALVQACPDDAPAHKNLASVLLDDPWSADPLAEALEHLWEAVRLAPRFADAHYGLGVALQRAGDHAGAMRQYQITLALDPEHASAHMSFLILTQQICDWAHLAEVQERSRHWLGGPYRTLPHVITPFSVAAMPSTPQEQQEAARRWVQGSGLGQQTQLPLRRSTITRTRSGPLRIGYMSADFFDDPVTAQTIGALERHDKRRVHTTGYCIGPPSEHTLRQRSMAACDAWVDLWDASAEEAARRIADDGVDVLVDVQGYTRGCRTEILARRPAPVQVNWMGLPATMGAPFIDYVVTDRYLTPPRQARYWDERFAYLPDCYMPADTARPIAARPTRQECGLPERGVVFCCFNHTIKITPACFDVWMRLLQQVKGSVLWLFTYHPVAPHQLRLEAEARGVDPGRLVFMERVDHPDYLARLSMADLFLDTWPYNAGATCNDALWAGLPVLTLPGQTYISRMAASQLRAVGLPDMVARSPRHYEHSALELAQSSAARGGLRLRLAHNRQTWPLFTMERYTRALEDAYGRMVRGSAR